MFLACALLLGAMFVAGCSGVEPAPADATAAKATQVQLQVNATMQQFFASQTVQAVVVNNAVMTVTAAGTPMVTPTASQTPSPTQTPTPTPTPTPTTTPTPFTGWVQYVEGQERGRVANPWFTPPPKELVRDGEVFVYFRQGQATTVIEASRWRTPMLWAGAVIIMIAVIVTVLMVLFRPLILLQQKRMTFLTAGQTPALPAPQGNDGDHAFRAFVVQIAQQHPDVAQQIEALLRQTESPNGREKERSE